MEEVVYREAKKRADSLISIFTNYSGNKEVSWQCAYACANMIRAETMLYPGTERSIERFEYWNDVIDELMDYKKKKDSISVINQD